MGPRELAGVWRTLADQQRKLGADAQARTLEWCADELTQAQLEWDLEELTLRDAARESGYGEDHLGRLVREGKLVNAGLPNAPRIRRCDLPRKPGRDGQRRLKLIGSKEQVARSVANSWEGASDG